MAILLNNNGYDNSSWLKALKTQLPDRVIYQYPDIPDALSIEYAVVWNHPKGDLAHYPNLKAILLLGAGTEHVDDDPELPDVPVVRLIDPAVVNDMALYANYWTMHFHRRYEDYRLQAQQKYWHRHDICATDEFRVSVMGLGQIGSQIIERIAINGFKAQGWDAFAKHIEGVSCFFGNAGLKQMLAQTDVLINCLPLNSGTQHMLNKERLSMLPQGAFLINLSRGAVIDDQALLSLLHSNHIAGAALDTFSVEPLPSDSPIWDCKQVYITPHIAGATYARSATKVIAANIRRVQRGEAPFPIHHIQHQPTAIAI
jgi:glyoxylate/hydroxypyruvate reductase A